ncbi:MAG: hypothetical protein Q4F27_01205 [Desulfovibrionaceae bacterium]|nr:hypothetical protein [Desulfovibrionaceae bacterium]
MNRKIIWLISALGLPILALAAVLAFWLGPQVEAHVRRSLAELTDDAGNPFPCTAEVVTFSPLTRHLEIAGLEGHDRKMQLNIARADLKLTWQTLAAFTPLRDVLLPASTHITAADRVEVRNISIRIPEGRLSLQRLEVDSLQLAVALLAAEQDSPRPDSISRHMGADRVYAHFCGMDIPGEGIYAGIDSMDMESWRGHKIHRIAFANTVLRQHGAELLRLKELAFAGITLPDTPLQALPRTPESLLQYDGTPLFARMSMQGLTAAGIELGSVQTDWQPAPPHRIHCRFSNFRLPVSLVVDAPIPGIGETITLAGESISEELGKGITQNQGHLSSPGLGSLAYALRSYPADASLSLELAQMQRKFSDMALTFTDEGLMARLALLSGQPQGFAPVLGMLAGQFIDVRQPGNAAIVEALRIFVSRPGKLEVRSLPGRQFSLTEAGMVLMARDPAKLFHLSAIPGQEDLDAQARRLALDPASAR